MNKKFQYYFAFGANMDVEFLTEVRKINVLSHTPGILEGAKIVFEAPGIPFLEPVFASVKPVHGSEVHGVIYKIFSKDLPMLNLHEGGNAYEMMTTDLVSYSGKVYTCFFFVSKKHVLGELPSKRYVNKIIKAAKKSQLSSSYINQLESSCVLHSKLSEILGAKAMKFMGLLFKKKIMNSKRIFWIWTHCMRKNLYSLDWNFDENAHELKCIK